MFFRMIYDEKLAQAAYLIGCQQTGQALLIDPQRDVDRYLALARSHGLRITAVAETHIHADFLSGARELAERTAARVYLSDEGGSDWKYEWLDKRRDGGRYDARLLRDGDTFHVGRIEFRALHTPGHTPEHMCYQVTDHGAGATEPIGIVTGDLLFVGDVGRPDLLETAAGQVGAAEPSARRLFASLRRAQDWPDFLQVWPGHGAGSACGKALGAVPQSTVGYEKRFNSAVLATDDERRFVDFVLAGQPEPPAYFARMKRLNRLGPEVLGGLPAPQPISADDLRRLAAHGSAPAGGSVLIDTRSWEPYRRGHVPGALGIPLDRTFPTVAGSYVTPESAIHLLVEAARVEEAVRDLIHVGLDDIRGYATPQMLAAYAAAGGTLDQAPEIDASAARDRIASGQVLVLDVRAATEFAEGHIPGARNINYTRLSLHLDELPPDRPILVHCRGGARSARACALLRRAGFDATNLAGGIMAWECAGLPVVR
jgi:hydroxyacylglutathione hydrolase